MNKLQNQFQNSDPLFNMTSSQELNNFIEKIKQLYSMEITDEEFKEAVEDLDNFRRRARSVIEAQCKSNVLSSEEKKSIDHILMRLSSVKSALEEVRLYFKDGKKEHIESGLERCKRYFEEMTQQSDKIQKGREAEKSKYSKAPLQNELMRIWYDVAKGKLSSKIFAEKLHDIKKGLKEYYNSADDFAESDIGARYYVLNRDEIRQVVKDYVKSLEDIEKYMAEGKSAEKYLLRSKEFAEKLLYHQEKMLNEVPI
ncbi:hypothetical protein IJJ97_05235, partial [bacterium]|nr:hypothetical protein [bacterium]